MGMTSVIQPNTILYFCQDRMLPSNFQDLAAIAYYVYNTSADYRQGYFIFAPYHYQINEETLWLNAADLHQLSLS